MARGAMISSTKRRHTNTRKRAESRDLPHVEALRIPDVVDFEASWTAYHLNNRKCEEHGAPQPKVKNCRSNPLCLHRLGLEKWEKLLKSQNHESSREIEYTPRDICSQPCGLVNVGNSCYVNSFLQICFNDLTLRQCIFDWRPDQKYVKSDFSRMDIQAVMNCLQELFVTMQITPYEDASAQKLVELLQLDNEQHDAIEFTMLFFDALDRNLAAHPNGEHTRRIIRKSYEGRVQETISCECGKTKSNGITTLRSVQLAIIGIKSLTQAIEKYFTPEVLTDYRCDMCGNVGTTTKVCELVELPPVLMVSLNRYSFDSQGRNKKVTSPLQFPKTLETRKFASNLSSWQYDLCAVMIHEGPNTDSGHYYDVIKDPISGHWFTYNDKLVKETKCPGCSVEKDTISRATPEMRGCYALIYRKIEKGMGLTPPEVRLPPEDVVEQIRSKLNLEFSRDRTEGTQSASVWNETVKLRYNWISELWQQLEIPDGAKSMKKPKSVVFVPTALLSEIQSIERKSVEVMKDVGNQIIDENTSRSDLYPLEPLPDTHLEMCSHGKLSLNTVIGGEAKLVNRHPAEIMLRRYNLGLKQQRKHIAQATALEDSIEYYSDVESNSCEDFCDGSDVCTQCVELFKYEGSFKDRLEQTCTLVQNILKDKFRVHDYKRVPCPPEYVPPPGAVWVSKKQLTSFKKLALRQMEFVRNNRSHEALQLSFTTNAATFMCSAESSEKEGTLIDIFDVEPAGNRKLSNPRTTRVDRSRNKRLDQTVEEVIRTTVPPAPAEDEFDITDVTKTNGNALDSVVENEDVVLPIHFNSGLLCPHEKLTYKVTRLWVLKDEWDEIVRGYFDVYNTVPCTEEECNECVDEFFKSEASQKEQNDKIVEIFKELGPLLRNADKRKWDPNCLGMQYTHTVCSTFLVNIKNAWRGKGKIPVPTICQNCILCSRHGLPYLDVDEVVFNGTARPVPLTSEEWFGLVNVFATHIPDKVADFTEILINVEENFCMDCAYENRRREDLRRYEYSISDIYVKLKGDEPDDCSSSANSKTATTRRALAKNLIKIKMRSTDTIMNLKLQLFRKLKQSPADQLIYNGEQLLENDATLAGARIDANNFDSPLTLIVQSETPSDIPRPLERGFRDTALGH
ncbi:hypothetical protein QR680_009529 [Steinernema hermaphroditum]|uniref:ubiquitinyl hydrolase 1 n=1 Tax=Steinernema hermaphroditum TaxID=289476 RepID=A0AA39M9V9_9BILA|nr:hypothetical protein QR680_009529 [Steinernema hermaphroditum]